MKFELYIHKSEGFIEILVRDTSKALNQAGSILLRSQSIYEEDGGKLVWKNAAYPEICWFNMRDLNGGFKIAEADYLPMLDANVNWKVLNHIWNSNRGK